MTLGVSAALSFEPCGVAMLRCGADGAAVENESVALPPPEAAQPCCTAAGRLPERTMPVTTAAPTASPSAAGSATSARRRGGTLQRRTGAGSEASTRARSPSGACGACARNRLSTVISFADIVHPLFQSSQGAAEPRRARGLADSEHARRARAVELEQHAQARRPRARPARARAAPPRTGREARRRTPRRAARRARTSPRACAAVSPRGTSRRRRCVRSGRARCAASRGAGRTGASVRNAFSNVSAVEILRRGAVAGEIDEVAVDGVELLRGDVGEAGPPAEQRRGVERGRGRVHAL